MNRHVRILLYSLISLLLITGCAKEEDKAVKEEDKIEKKSGLISVDGAELRYVMEGKGTPLIAIGSSYYLPIALSQELRQHLKLICVDPRWFAPTNTLADISKITMDMLVDDIEQVRKALGFDKIAVLGHSSYGLWALEYARQHPEHATHVIMHGTAPFAGSKLNEASDDYWESHASDERKEIYKRNMEEVEDILSSLSTGDFTTTYAKNGPKIFYDPNYDCSWLWEGVKCKADIANHWFNVIVPEYDFTQGEPITTPVFIAVGRYDYWTPYYLWDDYKDKLPNLSYNLFEKSGHYPMFEEQELFDRKLIEWISSQ